MAVIVVGLIAFASAALAVAVLLLAGCAVVITAGASAGVLDATGWSVRPRLPRLEWTTTEGGAAVLGFTVTGNDHNGRPLH